MNKYDNKINFIGDVPAITEITGNFNAAITELVKGVPAQTLFQLSIQNSWSKLFDVVNDPVSKVIVKTFKNIPFFLILI